MFVRVKDIKGTLLLSGVTEYKIVNDPNSKVKPNPYPWPGKPEPVKLILCVGQLVKKIQNKWINIYN
ncbi:hypothetical protein [Spiroplasma endosymbiont of Othius punctulatus]|uniref:hypothetical protein n=1 Tax=Spiroplasma endosymbiont of Othius punctulatus TaxID=3066289 RepID=UPI0030D55231